MFKNSIYKFLLVFLCFVGAKQMLAAESVPLDSYPLESLRRTSTSVDREYDKKEVVQDLQYVYTIPLTRAFAEKHDISWSKERQVVIFGESEDASVLTIPEAYAGFFDAAQESWDEDSCLYGCFFPEHVLEKALKVKEIGFLADSLDFIKRGALNFDRDNNKILYGLRKFTQDIFSDFNETCRNKEAFYRTLLKEAAKTLFILPSDAVLHWNVQKQKYGKGASNLQVTNTEALKTLTFVLNQYETERFDQLEKLLLHDKKAEWVYPLKVVFYIKNGQPYEEDLEDNGEDATDAPEEKGQTCKDILEGILDERRSEGESYILPKNGEEYQRLWDQELEDLQKRHASERAKLEDKLKFDFDFLEYHTKKTTAEVSEGKKNPPEESTDFPGGGNRDKVQRELWDMICYSREDEHKPLPKEDMNVDSYLKEWRLGEEKKLALRYEMEIERLKSQHRYEVECLKRRQNHEVAHLRQRQAKEQRRIEQLKAKRR